MRQRAAGLGRFYAPPPRLTAARCIIQRYSSKISRRRQPADVGRGAGNPPAPAPAAHRSKGHDQSGQQHAEQALAHDHARGHQHAQPLGMFRRLCALGPAIVQCPITAPITTGKVTDIGR